MMNRQTLSRSLGRKSTWTEYQAFLDSINDCMCMCVPEGSSRVQFCSEQYMDYEPGRCFHASRRVTDLWNSWVDGTINRAEFIQAVTERFEMKGK